MQKAKHWSYPRPPTGSRPGPYVRTGNRAAARPARSPGAVRHAHDRPPRGADQPTPCRTLVLGRDARRPAWLRQDDSALTVERTRRATVRLGDAGPARALP